jgi:hypothetical protein
MRVRIRFGLKSAGMAHSGTCDTMLLNSLKPHALRS